MFTWTNLIIASALALLVTLLGMLPLLRRWPAVMHILWLIVLAKFVTPAFTTIPILRAEAPIAIANAPAPLLPPAAAPAIENAVVKANSDPQPERIHTPAPIPWSTVLLVVSLSGTAIILLNSLLNLLRLDRILRHAAPDTRLDHLLNVCRKKMTLSRWPNSLVIRARCSPFLLAIPGRACIYIPQTMLDELCDAQLEPIICHELAHHLRHDALANLFAFFVTAALWWNPLVWWARRQLRCAQELCCDALVINGQSISRRDYAEILLNTLDQITGAYQAPAHLAVGWGNVASLKERFRMIGDRNVIPRLSRTAAILALLLSISLLCIPGRAQSPAAGQPPAKDAAKLKPWKAQIIDGETGKPLPDMRIQSDPSVKKTDADGMIEIAVPEQNTIANVNFATPGWWTENMNFMDGRVTDREPRRDPNKPVQIKAWRGTIVTGRLLSPDAKPIPNAMLLVGTYITSQEWKKRLGMDLSFNSWDHGDWANWAYHFETDDEGRFEATIPPDDARWWIRISTMEFGSNYATGQDPNGPAKAIVNYAPFEKQIEEKSVDGRVNFGDIQLTRGTILRGQVVDALGNGLGRVMLYTSGAHGPYFGRSATTDADGRYQFLPMHPGPFTLSPYAQWRDEKGNSNTRDVQAVFIPQQINLAESDKPVDLTIRAVPHITLEFEWIDRRAKKGPVSYYGEFVVNGQVKSADGKMTMWRGVTEMTKRDGKEIIFVKVPASLKNPTLTLPADSVVTASYADEKQKSGPGTFELEDITEARHRVIYGDEPTPRKP